MKETTVPAFSDAKLGIFGGFLQSSYSVSHFWEASGNIAIRWFNKCWCVLKKNASAWFYWRSDVARLTLRSAPMNSGDVRSNELPECHDN